LVARAENEMLAVAAGGRPQGLDGVQRKIMKLAAVPALRWRGESLLRSNNHK